MYNDKNGRLVDAHVLSCESVFKRDEFTRESIGYFEITVDFPGLNGDTIVKKIRNAIPYSPGDIICCRYFDEKDSLKVELPKEDKKKTKRSILIFGVCFLFFIAISITFVWLSLNDYDKEMTHIAGYCISILFIIFGIYGIYKKIMFKKKCNSMISIEGVQVDYTVKRENFNTKSYSGSIVYTPVYEFEFDGKKHRLFGSISSSRNKYRTIGRKVRILIDPESRKVICEEDKKTALTTYMLFGIIGVVVFILLSLVK